jgi:hypothetical protein
VIKSVIMGSTVILIFVVWSETVYDVDQLNVIVMETSE